MNEPSVIGTGVLGAAVTCALLQANYAVTIWNRTEAKTEPLQSLGAKKTTSVAKAVRASQLVFICLTDCATTKAVLDVDDVTTQLPHRTLLQLGTSTAQDARESEAWATRYGSNYLDGTIMAYAKSVGAKDTMIFVSGEKTCFLRWEPYFKTLGGDVRYLGAAIGAAATLDMAFHCYLVGSLIGLIQGALLCEAENLRVDVLASVFAEGTSAKERLDRIYNNSYDHSDATINLWHRALQQLEKHTRDAGVNSDLSISASSFFHRAVSAGLGDQDIAALFKVLRHQRTS
jgi:3-hydroxyisobutyrate dehydrogenase-like beta-hydroxyacid dehydrogenase